MRSRKLITQNLLVSAANHEINQYISPVAIHDLSVIIDLYCLYDEIHIVGKKAYHSLQQHKLDFLSAIDEIAITHDFEENSSVSNIASAHLAAYLGSNSSAGKFEDLLGSILTPSSIERAVSMSADVEDDLEGGKKWLQNFHANTDFANVIKNVDAINAAASYVTRSFLYIAFSEANKITLTPDATRAPFLDGVIKKERSLREQLLQSLNRTDQESKLGDSFQITRCISPLASVVFERSYPNRLNIVKKMQDLRVELEPIRLRLGKIEDELQFASRDDEINTYKKWENIFGELEKRFGVGEGALSRHKLIGFGENAAKVAENPAQISSWAKIIGLPVEVIRSFWLRQPVIEVHRLRKEMPATSRLLRTAESLFSNSST